MPAHDDDLLGAHALGRDHAAQPDRTVADHGRPAALADARHDRRMVAGAHHVRQREQRGHQGVILAGRQPIQRAVGLRNAQRLGLRATDLGIAEEAAVHARGLQAFVAELATAVGPGERHDDHVADLDRAHVVADGLDHADGLVAHVLALAIGWLQAIWPQVAAADAGADDADQRIGGLPDGSVGNVLDPHVAGLVHDRCAHGGLPRGVQWAVVLRIGDRLHPVDDHAAPIGLGDGDVGHR